MVLAGLMVLFGAVTPAGASSPTTSTSTTVPDPPAKAELLVDVDTGRVLMEQNAHTPMPPGSLTKILTAMIAYAWLPPTTEIHVSVQAASVTPERIGMSPGQVWPFEDTLRAMLIFSANDAAYALGQTVSGNLAHFAPVMQYAAEQIGMRDNPVLEDPAGLDGSEGFNGGNRISAWDLATAARDLMANPALAAIVATKQLDFTGPNGTVYGLDSQNLYFLNTYPGAIGVKTGLTDAAGFCVIEEAERGNRKLMAVVLNGQNSYQTAAFLLNQGFSTTAASEGPGPTLPAIKEPSPPKQSTVSDLQDPDSPSTSSPASSTATSPTTVASSTSAAGAATSDPPTTPPANSDPPSALPSSQAGARLASSTGGDRSSGVAVPAEVGGGAAIAAVAILAGRAWRRRNHRSRGTHRRTKGGPPDSPTP